MPTTPKQSYPSHGILNDIRKPIVQDRFDLEDGTAAGTIRRMSEQAYTPDSLKNTGPYKAIVLKVEEKDDNEPGSFVDSFYVNLFGQGSIPSLVKIKARIPELHSMLPIPNSLGPTSTEPAIIEMYPTFIAKDETVPPPEVSSLVWVDFTNKTNFTDPIYLGPVKNTKTDSGAKGNVSAADAHNGSCGGTLSSNCPTGDSMSGKNVPLAHTGLPLLPRTTTRNISNEHKMIKGNRASQVVVDSWSKALKARSVPGTSWIGVMDSNGRVDDKHKRGKRDTIIFIPNTTEPTVSIELIYYFHGLGEFNNNREFKDRIAPQISQLVKSKRNFIIIIPELTWSADGSGKQGTAWKGNDNFARFHSESLTTIKSILSKTLNIGYITIVCHSAGGSALLTALKTGGIGSVSPNKFVLSDCDYYGVTEALWNGYVKNNKNIEFNALTQKKGKPFQKTKEFLLKSKLSGDTEEVWIKSLNKGHRQIGDIAIAFVNPKSGEKRKNETAKEIEKARAIISKDDNKTIDEIDLTIARDTAEVKIPKSPNVPESSIPQSHNQSSSPSILQKNSLTRKPLPNDVIVREAEPNVEARVYLSDYKPLSIKENRNLLVDVGGGRYLHVLAAKRFKAMNEAWMSETGGKPIKIASGLRKRKWRDYDHYLSVLRAKCLGKTRLGVKIETDEQVLKIGKKLIAFNSAHETGLAFDIGSHGLEPNSATIQQQKQTKLYNWLVQNSCRFGITPYKVEPWHWEIRLPRESFTSGKEFTDNYAVIVVKVGKGGSLASSPGTALASNGKCVSKIGNIG